ncbi:hypothetical protein MRX96_017465 [Rhipicephalus microplus]|uniref:uncharacterized protein LOC142777508 n=1 Tax=Rhipicephalus microplus TaxID=6941 RepID=UPI003F6C8041
MALKYLIELNICSFHFGADLNFAELLQDGSLDQLHAFSASPCALRCPSVLRRLAQACPDLADLDVRYERKNGVVQCTGCEEKFVSEPKDATDIREGVTKAFFPNGLARLSLEDEHDTACLWFIENCSPATTVRLCNCPSSREHERLGRMLENKSMPSCLIHWLKVVEEPYLLARVCFVTSLEYVTKLSWNRFSENVVRMFVRTSSTSLPRLKYLHVHYMKCPDDDLNNRITWMRGPCSRGSEALVRYSPCIQSCSTATFIGLAKPLNRNMQPML